MKRNILLLSVIIITVIFCATPNFHPEEYLHANYKWWLDMAFHSSYYLAITAVLYPLFRAKRGKGEEEERSDTFNWVYFLVVLVISYGLEVDQLFVPGRSFSLLDLTSNTIGVCLSALISYYIFHFRPVKKVLISKN